MNDLGAAGESLAEAHLRKLGYRILARNFETGPGELDIVAMDGRTLVFVEVKQRGGLDLFDGPEGAVDSRKQRKIARAAAIWLQHAGRDYEEVRFDVIAIEGPELRHLPDAFPSPIRFTL